MKIFAIAIYILFLGTTVFAQEEVFSQILSSEPRGRSPWSVSAFNIASVDREPLETGAAQISSYGYLSFNYRLASGNRFSIRPSYYFNTAGWDKYGGVNKQELDLSDLIFVYSHYDVFLLPGDIGYSGNYRLYLPTGSDSQMKHQIARFKAVMIFTRHFGRGLELNYFFEPAYYVQSQTVYNREINETRADGTINSFSIINQNKSHNLDQYFRITQRFSQTWGISASAGTSTGWYYGSEAEGREPFTRSNLKLEVSGLYSLNNKVSFNFGISNFADMPGAQQTAELFRPDQMQAKLLTFVRL